MARNLRLYPVLGITLWVCGFTLLQGAEAHWVRLRSENFELYTSAGPRAARDTLREFEQVRGFFVQVFGGPPGRPVPIRLVAFNSTKEYEPYRLNEYATAYYQPTADRDYIVMSHAGSDVFPIAVHEYVHLLVRHSDLDLPPWLNEGLAELYSTLRPLGDKIIIGDLIPGRYQALLQDKWVPLAVILAADRHSPYYNEKNKAGSLYNEGWALTHMLYFRSEYRPKFGQLLKTVSAGTGSAQALQQVYARSLEQVEKDLQAYLHGSSFKAGIVSATLQKSSADTPAEPLDDFDLSLVLTEMSYRPGKEAAQQTAWERLQQQDPKRPEPYRALGYLAWRGGRLGESVTQFGKAFEHGERDSKFLWDYGRLLERAHGEQAIPVFQQLLSQDGARLDVRLELAETQVRAHRASEALATLAPIHKVTPEESARFFRIAVYAHLMNGDRKNASETALHFREIARTDKDREEADRLVSQTKIPDFKLEPRPAEIADPGRPHIVRRDSATEAAEAPASPPAERPSISGRFVELDCRGAQARMIVETGAGRRTFLIEDAAKIAIVSGSDGPVDMTCGPQKSGGKVDIGYDPPRAGQAGIDGIVRTLAF